MPSKKKSTKKKTKKTSKAKKESSKASKFLEEAKEMLDSLSKDLFTTAIKLPSLVTTQNTDVYNMNGVIENKFEMDIEMIIMLEEFFGKLVYLLNLRASYDKKLNKITKIIRKLKEVKTNSEFKGNLQLLGISLVEMEQIVRNYQEIYSNLFTEQAMLQFQLMEQLMVFRDSDLSHFTNLFDSTLETFNKLNEKLSKISEK